MSTPLFGKLIFNQTSSVFNHPYKKTTLRARSETNFIQTSVLELPVSATDTPQSLKLIGIRWSLQLVKLLAVTAWQQQPIGARFARVAAPFL